MPTCIKVASVAYSTLFGILIKIKSLCKPASLFFLSQPIQHLRLDLHGNPLTWINYLCQWWRRGRLNDDDDDDTTYKRFSILKTRHLTKHKQNNSKEIIHDLPPHSTKDDKCTYKLLHLVCLFYILSQQHVVKLVKFSYWPWPFQV